MANICSVDLKLNRDEVFEEKEVEDIKQYLNDNIAYDGVYDISESGEEYLEIQMDTKWNIPTELLQEFSKKFRCETRAIGREDGCSYLGFVKINNEGIVEKEEEIDTM